MKKNKKLTTIILVIIFFVGLCVLLYPTVSNFVNSRLAGETIIQYDDSVKEKKEAEIDEMINDAKDYNTALASNSHSFKNGESKDEAYNSTLNIDGKGMMGYITIDKIDVNLPIYHGTSSDVLSKGVGHIEGSSLPVGGKSTHCVLSGHRGLPASKLFTDLDDLEIGDTFTITVLDRVITYEVDQIKTVLPDGVTDLDIVDGEDYVTLVTCTPYGVNTHRLLVRGHRIENLAEMSTATADALQVDTKIVALCIAIPILAILLIWVLIHYRKKRNKVSDESSNDNLSTDNIDDSKNNSDDEKKT
jgi:sortase A